MEKQVGDEFAQLSLSDFNRTGSGQIDGEARRFPTVTAAAAAANRVGLGFEDHRSTRPQFKISHARGLYALILN